MENLLTWRKYNIRASRIASPLYEKIRFFILSELATSDGTTLSELLSSAASYFEDQKTKEINWFLVQVKQDLQLQNLIKISFGPGCVQFIKIKPEAKVKVRGLLSSTLN